MPAGILQVDFNANVCSLFENPGTRRLARQGPGDIFGNAFNFVVGECGLQDGQPIVVGAGPGTNNAVIFVVTAGPAPQGVAPMHLGATASKKAAKKVSTKAAKKSSKSTPKSPATKATKKAAKKIATKKVAKKKPVRSATKKSSKK